MRGPALIIGSIVFLSLFSNVGLWSLEGWHKWAMLAVILGGAFVVCIGIVGTIASLQRS